MEPNRVVAFIDTVYSCADALNSAIVDGTRSTIVVVWERKLRLCLKKYKCAHRLALLRSLLFFVVLRA